MQNFLLSKVGHIIIDLDAGCILLLFYFNIIVHIFLIKKYY
jgi:hypothetical protein